MGKVYSKIGFENFTKEVFGEDIGIICDILKLFAV
jgi:hypothetical protein